ncbi:MAG: DUF898 domain-containing protein [Sphingobium sp.]|nr:DUF898 domain-containing protein [Sphingobium sp.]
MNDQQGESQRNEWQQDVPQRDGPQYSAFGFDGSWKEYAPIAFTNLLLTIVTLGIYRFWATTRSRRYFWSRTRFVDERLEWTGTGKELFLGFIMAVLLLGAPLLFIQFGAQAMILRGMADIAALLSMLSFLAIFYLMGVARFRALRYRLGRTYWRGIRGGSDDAGFGYGWSYMWKTTVGMLPASLLVPWSMTELWNNRWNKMSFGSQNFTADARAMSVFWRFLLFYLLPFIMVALITFVSMTSGGMVEMMRGGAGGPPPVAFILTIIGAIFGFYILLGLIALAYYAAFLREAIGSLSLGQLDFGFEAKTIDWLKLFFGDVLLVVCTLGIGWIFLQYRHWKFFITHMESYGVVDPEALTQSTTQLSRHGEGLLDALDVGAF